MPPQSRAAHVFAGDAVEIDLILKGIKTFKSAVRFLRVSKKVEIDLILKGIKTCERITSVLLAFPRGNRPDSQRD